MNKNIGIALLTSLLAIGCVQVPPEQPKMRTKLAISSVRDIPVSYAQGSRFSLESKHAKETLLKPHQTQAVYQLYADAIITDLEEHAFKNQNDSSSVDFYVGFGVALAINLSEQTIIEKFGVTPGLPNSDVLEKGSFLIYIKDTRTGKIVWRGVAQGFVHKELNKEQRQQRTAEIVDRVMRQFYATN
jgi:hypothetical protein